MKTITFLTLLLFTHTGVFAQTDYSTYDNEKGTSMMPILKMTEPLIKSFEEDLEIVRMEYDIISNSSKSTLRTLYKGVKYGIMVTGDYRVEDMDLTLYKFNSSTNDWDLVSRDNKEESHAVAFVEPDETVSYKVVISAYKFKGEYTAAHYSLLIIR